MMTKVVEEEGKKTQMTCQGAMMEGQMEVEEEAVGRKPRMICQEVRMEEPRVVVEEAE